MKRRINWRNIPCAVVLMCICFVVLFVNRKLPFFASDEGDNFLGGKMVANGLDVYKEFQSQHMPLMYYVCAIFYLLGARTVIAFRLCFYALLCLLWGAMYVRYCKYYGFITMFLYPLLYLCVMHFMDFGYSVLSEQLWAQGMVILLLEYMIYIKHKEVSMASACWISFAILISFGTAFMAIPSIGIIFLGVFYTEIMLQVKGKSGFVTGVSNIWKRNRVLLLIILLPFVLLIIWYLISGNLGNAYYGSFVVNREFYPNYMPNIQSTFGTLIDCFINLKNWILSTQYTEVYFQIVVFCLFIFMLIIKKLYSASICVFFFTIFCAIRGIDNFHALQLHGVFMMMAAILLGRIVKVYIEPKYNIARNREKFMIVCGIIVSLAVVCFPFYRTYYEHKGLLKIVEGESVDAHPEGYDVINQLVDENEKIYECILNPWFYFSTETLPVTTSAVCPWIYDAYHDKILADLEQEKPRIIVYSEDFNVWGHRFGDFASDLCKYFDENYTLLEGYTQIYVRNDYYQEAINKIAQ